MAHEFAVKKWREDMALPGIRGAIWWLVVRDNSLGKITSCQPSARRNLERQQRAMNSHLLAFAIVRMFGFL